MGMKKLVSFLLLGTLFLLSIAGCEHFLPGNGNNKIQLPVGIIADNKSYFSETVKLGIVEKSRKLYLRNDGGTACFYWSVTLSEQSLFDVGEKGKLTIDTSVPKDPNFGKTIVYNAIVIKKPSDSSDQYVIQITDEFDKNIVKNDTRAVFKILVERKTDVIAIPLSAVKNYNSKTIVGVLKNGTREDRIVKLGLVGDEMVEIISGISVDENIVFK